MRANGQLRPLIRPPWDPKIPQGGMECGECGLWAGGAGWGAGSHRGRLHGIRIDSTHGSRFVYGEEGGGGEQFVLAKRPRKLQIGYDLPLRRHGSRIENGSSLTPRTMPVAHSNLSRKVKNNQSTPGVLAKVVLFVCLVALIPCGPFEGGSGITPCLFSVVSRCSSFSTHPPPPFIISSLVVSVFFFQPSPGPPHHQLTGGGTLAVFFFTLGGERVSVGGGVPTLRGDKNCDLRTDSTALRRALFHHFEFGKNSTKRAGRGGVGGWVGDSHRCTPLQPHNPPPRHNCRSRRGGHSSHVYENDINYTIGYVTGK